MKTSFKRDVWKSYFNRFWYFFRSCMFAERKTSILLRKISLTCKYEWLVVTQATQVHRKKRVLSAIKLVTCVKQSLAQVLCHLCHATTLGCLWLEDGKDVWAQNHFSKDHAFDRYRAHTFILLLELYLQETRKVYKPSQKVRQSYKKSQFPWIVRAGGVWLKELFFVYFHPFS